MLSGDFRRVVAVALVLTTTFITMPVSAADLTAPRSVIGSVSSVRSVELRGVGISQEGTLFSGDSIRAREKGYAKVLLRTGSKLELSEKTEVTVNSDEQGVKIAMNTGTMGFSSLGSPVRVMVQPFEISGSADAVGRVSIASHSAAIRALSGSVRVRNLKSAESFVLTKGMDRFVGLDGSDKGSLGELASNIPGPIPTVPPQRPAGQTSGGIAMDAGAWVAVIAGAAVAGIAITGLVIAMNNKDDLDEIRSQNAALSSQIAAQNTALTGQISTLSGQVTALGNQITANQAATTATLNALAAAGRASEAAFNARLNALAIQLTASQAQAAVAATPSLSAQQQATFRARAQSIASQAQTATQSIATIESQINAIEAQIAQSGTVTPAQQTQLTNLRNALNAAINDLNTVRQQELQLVADLQAAGVQGVQSQSQQSASATTLIAD